MSKYDRLFDRLGEVMNSSLEKATTGTRAATPPAAVAAGPSTLEDMVKSLTERVDSIVTMLAPEGPVAKAIAEQNTNQNQVIEAVEKSLERLETVEKAGARPHSINGDGNPAPQTPVEKSGVNTEWDAAFRHMSAGGKVRLTGGN